MLFNNTNWAPEDQDGLAGPDETSKCLLKWPTDSIPAPNNNVYTKNWLELGLEVFSTFKYFKSN